MSFDRLNQYRIMWVFVYFDLPTETKPERKAASDFRKMLLKDGYNMLQFSVYVRHCSSAENAEVHKNRAKNMIPEKGNVIIFEITDAQFGRIQFFTGHKRSRRPYVDPQQLELF